MPDFIQRILDNPVAFIGALRAVALALAPFVPTLFTPDRLDAVFYGLSLALPLISLLFTGASAKAHDEAVQAALMTTPPVDVEHGDYG